MKNNHLFTALLAALLCLSLIACGTADALNNSAGVTTGPVIPIEDAEPPAISDKNREPVSSCAVSEDITASLLQDAYPVGTQSLTLVLENRGDETLTYGEEVSFEKFTDGAWKPVSTIDSYCFNSMAYLLQPHSMGAFTISPWFLTEPLRAGLYRVTGGEMWTGDSRSLTAWQVEFRVTEDAQPEPDYAVFIPGQPLQNPEHIPAYVVNTTGKAGSILQIPHLDRQNAAGQWEEVPYAEGVGFCGTSDPLPPEGMELLEPVEPLWGQLTSGRYRLSFDMTGTDPANRTAGGEFVIEDTPGNNSSQQAGS